MKTEIKHLSLILALLTSCLYVYGLTFHQGFLRYWGLEETMFPLSVERTLFQGFVASSYFATKTVFPLFAFTVVFFILMVLFSLMEKVIQNKRGFEKIAKIFSSNKQSYNGVPERIVSAGNMVAFMYWVVAAFVVMLLMILVADYFGRESAQNRYLQFIEDGPFVEFMHKEEGKIDASPIVCSATHCAYFSNQKILVYPLSDIKKIASKVMY